MWGKFYQVPIYIQNRINKFLLWLGCWQNTNNIDVLLYNSFIFKIK